MNENVRKYREQILKIATDMGDWVKSETKDFPKFYKNTWRFSDKFLNYKAPLCPIIRGDGVVGVMNKHWSGCYIRGGRVYWRSNLLDNDKDEDVTNSFLTDDKFCDYWTLVEGVEEIYRNWSSIKADVKEKKAQYNSVLSYNGL